jgi:FAD/FMN-containing dehydrogenase
LSLGSEGTCQIAGNIATNAGGTAVLRYEIGHEQSLESRRLACRPFPGNRESIQGRRGHGFNLTALV